MFADKIMNSFKSEMILLKNNNNKKNPLEK